MCSNVGRVRHCQTRVEANESVTAEIMFEDVELAQVAAEQFDGANADGHILDAETCRVSTIPALSNFYSSGQQAPAFEPIDSWKQ